VSGPKTNALPTGWASAKLGEICDPPQYGWTTSATDASNAVKLLRSTDISHGTVNWETVPFCETPPPAIEKYQLHSGDIVITRTGAGVGNSLLLDDCPRSVFASYLIRFRPHDALSAEYVAYFLKGPSYRTLISQNAAGIAQPNVNATKLASLELPLAPRKTQDTIVAEIEKQFTRLDAAVAALERVQANLKRYRAAVLKAACEGRLVPTEAELARRDGRPNEPASVERILAERRSHWETAKLAKLKASGKTPKDQNSKDGYPHPSSASLPEMSVKPDGWTWVSLETVADVIDPNPSHRMPHYVDDGISFISSENFTDQDGIDFSLGKKVTNETLQQQIARFTIEEGDFALSRIGTIGKTRFLPTERNYCLSHALVLIQSTTSAIDRRFLRVVCSSEAIGVLAKERVQSVGVPDLGMAKIRSLPTPIPPLPEQLRIVAEVDRRLSIIHEVEIEVDSDLRRAKRLRQSILKYAFEGNLVPQDPNDEPANVLLERIRSEREAKTGSGKSRKQARGVVVQ